MLVGFLRQLRRSWHGFFLEQLAKGNPGYVRLHLFVPILLKIDYDYDSMSGPVFARSWSPCLVRAYGPVSTTISDLLKKKKLRRLNCHCATQLLAVALCNTLDKKNIFENKNTVLSMEPPTMIGYSSPFRVDIPCAIYLYQACSTKSFSKACHFPLSCATVFQTHLGVPSIA